MVRTVSRSVEDDGKRGMQEAIEGKLERKKGRYGSLCNDVNIDLRVVAKPDDIDAAHDSAGTANRQETHAVPARGDVTFCMFCALEAWLAMNLLIVNIDFRDRMMPTTHFVSF